MAPSASRVLAMLELLQANRHMTGPALAERLAVDERTVRRYAGTLADLGIPVTTERGRYGGYRLMPGFKLPPLMLTDDEAVAVVLGLVAADHLGLTAEAPATAAAEAKIARVLPPVLADRLGALRDSLGFTMRRPTRNPESDVSVIRSGTPGRAGAAERDTPEPGGGDRSGFRLSYDTRTATDTLLTLGAATRARQRLTITYRARAGSTTTRDLDPYGLVFHKGRWYAVGHDHRSDEVRSFRVDRIVTVETTEATFEPPHGFDAVAHLNTQLAGLPWMWEVEVLIETDAVQVRRYIPESMATLSEAEVGVLLRCRAQDLTGMARMLAGLGAPFTIIRPDELRKTLAEHAARLTAYAARPHNKTGPGRVRPEGIGSEAVGSEAVGSEAMGSEAAGSKVAGLEVPGSDAARREAARPRRGGPVKTGLEEVE
jgi:predicted DNA-binding transcriptional regulator YafY